jgi:hypothetical protein
MKKQGLGKKLILSRETLTALDPNLMAQAGGYSGNTCVTCTSRTSAVSVCRPGDTNPLCE